MFINDVIHLRMAIPHVSTACDVAGRATAVGLQLHDAHGHCGGSDTPGGADGETSPVMTKA